MLKDYFLRKIVLFPNYLEFIFFFIGAGKDPVYNGEVLWNRKAKQLNYLIYKVKVKPFSNTIFRPVLSIKHYKRPTSDKKILTLLWNKLKAITSHLKVQCTHLSNLSICM